MSVSKQPIGIDQSHIGDKTTVLALVDMRSALGREFLATTLEDARETGKNLAAIRMAYRKSRIQRWMVWLSHNGRAVPLYLGAEAFPLGLGRAVAWWKDKIKPDTRVIGATVAFIDPRDRDMAMAAIEEGVAVGGMLLAKPASAW